MNFDLTEDQRLLVKSVASFVKKESPITRLRKLREDPVGWSKEVWAQMGELGWLAIAFPEAAGGLGGSFVDAALILQQLGTTLAPEPFIPALIAISAMLQAGNEGQWERWVKPVIEGSQSIALAYAEAQSRFDVTDVETRAESTEHGYRISGTKIWVLNGHAADTLVVSARTGGESRDAEGVSLFVVERGTEGLRIEPVTTMDGHHAAVVHLDKVSVGKSQLVGEAGGAAKALELAMDVGAAAACAEGFGIMQTVLNMTTEYLKTREQFGVKIGNFQALQHRAVDMFIETELCKSTSILASIKVEDADEVERKSAISAAKVQLAVGGRQVTQQAIQLHGGIGITDEHDVGLYFKRMHVLNTLFGDEEHHVKRFASLPNFWEQGISNRE